MSPMDTFCEILGIFGSTVVHIVDFSLKSCKNYYNWSAGFEIMTENSLIL